MSYRYPHQDDSDENGFGESLGQSRVPYDPGNDEEGDIDANDEDTVFHGE